MRTDLTDITLIVDKSGSMRSTQSDAEGGINLFVESQKQAAGEAKFSLVEFDTCYRMLYQGADIQSVKPYHMTPGGNTALLDALGRSIDEAGARLAAMPESERPGLVVFVVVTDGQENASREYTRAQVRDMVQHQQNVYSWRFVYLGSDLSTFQEAGSLGFRMGTTSRFSSENTVGAYACTASNLARSRATLTSGGIVLPDALDYSESDRNKMVDANS